MPAPSLPRRCRLCRGETLIPDVAEPISIAITTRNRPESLRRCVASLALLGDLVGEILIGDDLSEMPADRQIAGQVSSALAPLITVLRAAEKRGYIINRNSMVQSARFPFVLLLDDDTCILDRQAVAGAVRVMAASGRVAAVAFAQADGAGAPWPAGMQPSPVGYPCYVPSFIGFAHLLRRDVFLQLGGYRGTFEFYGEEKEYCLRLLDAGFDVVYLPEARIAHVPDGAGRHSRTYVRYVSRNDCLGSLYNDPWWRLLWMLPARVALYLRMRRAWRIADPGGLRWLLHEIGRNWPEIRRARRPVRSATFRRWRALRRQAPPYPASTAAA